MKEKRLLFCKNLSIDHVKFFLSVFLVVNLASAVFGQMQQYNVQLIRSELIVQHPPFASCHASTIAETAKGNLIAAWFAGSYEGCSDVKIWTSVYHKGKWSIPVVTASGHLNDSVSLPCWNPVLFKTQSGRLALFYKVGKSPREWKGMVMFSEDNGITWGSPSFLPGGGIGPVKNKPVQLSSGCILCPSSTESMDGKAWKAHIERTNERFDSWNIIPVDTVSTFAVIQPTLLIHSDGTLQLLCRSAENCIIQSWSGDEGKHWSALEKTGIPNPNSGIDAIILKNGLFVLVYNPLQKGEKWVEGRNILAIALSEDGTHWEDVYTLENQPSGEYSYPAVIQTWDSLIHILYTADRKNIRHCVFRITRNRNYRLKDSSRQTA